MLKKVLILIIFTINLLNSNHKYVNQMYNDENILDLVEKFLPKNPVIVEVGGYQGKKTEAISKKWPNGVIHVFEPLSSAFAILKQKAQSLINVFFYPYALSNTTGNINFYICENVDYYSSILRSKPLYGHLIFSNPIPVNSITLDDWKKQNIISNIDFLYLDSEGSELMILKSLSKEIMSNLKVIYTIVNFQEFREGNGLYLDFKNYLKENKFDQVWGHLNSSRQGIVLFVKDKLLQ